MLIAVGTYTGDKLKGKPSFGVLMMWWRALWDTLVQNLPCVTAIAYNSHHFYTH